LKDKAIQYFQRAVQEAPDDPLGYFFEFSSANNLSFETIALRLRAGVASTY
jgi:hypothetical protein